MRYDAQPAHDLPMNDAEYARWIRALTRTELQTRCKELALRAIGSNAAIVARLLAERVAPAPPAWSAR